MYLTLFFFILYPSLYEFSSHGFSQALQWEKVSDYDVKNVHVANLLLLYIYMLEVCIDTFF